MSELQEFDSVRLKVLYSEPLFSYLLYNLEVQSVEDPDLTSGTDGVELKIGVPFWNSLSLSNKVGIVIHELMHIMLEHPFTMSLVNEEDFLLFNTVGDIIINKIIRQQYSLPWNAITSFGALHHNCKDLDTIPVTEHSTMWFFEQVKNKLPKSYQVFGQGDIKQGGKQGCGHGSCIKENKSQEQRDVIRGQIYSAIASGLGIGTIAGQLKTIFEKFSKTQTDWKALVRQYFRIKMEEEYTFAKPKQYNRVILPRIQFVSENKLDIVLIMDSSGSITDDVLHKFGCELLTLLKTVGRKIYLIVNDADIQLTKEIEKVEDIPLEFPGRGGTMFEKAFGCLDNVINKLEEPIVVVLTDGEIGDLDKLKQPRVPVLWCVIDRDKFKQPFGTVVNLPSLR